MAEVTKRCDRRDPHSPHWNGVSRETLDRKPVRARCPGAMRCGSCMAVKTPAEGRVRRGAWRCNDCR